MKLYDAALSPNALRVRAVANELDIALQLIPVDLQNRENRTETFLALNPNGKVPVLVDGEFVLWESRAICAYLANVDPKQSLYPPDPKERAIVDQWCYWHAVHLSPSMQRVPFERIFKKIFGMGPPDEKAIKAALREVSALLPVLDANLAEKEWIAGDLTIADFTVATAFVFRDEAGISLEAYGNVDAWIKRLEGRSSWQSAARPVVDFLRDSSSG